MLKGSGDYFKEAKGKIKLPEFKIPTGGVSESYNIDGKDVSKEEFDAYSKKQENKSKPQKSNLSESWITASKNKFSKKN